MRISKSLPLTILFSVVLVLVIAFCITETVISQSNEARCIEEKYYDEMENAYLTELKQLLTEEGYRNSGVTLTRVIDEAGVRSYTVSIHHKLICKMSSGEQEQLVKILGTVTFADASCAFCHKFL